MRRVLPHTAEPRPQLSFYYEYQTELHKLFVALGREHEWRGSPGELQDYTQPRWVGVEHGNSDEKDQFTPDQEEAAQPILRDLGLVDEVLPRIGKYDQIAVVGGMMRVNRERLQFIKNLLDKGNTRTNQLVFWGGERSRDDRDDAEITKMDIPSLASDRWVNSQLANGNHADPYLGFPTETELGRVAFVETFGVNSWHTASELRIKAGGKSAAPVYQVASNTFSIGHNNYPEFVLMNCPAVDRGDDRPPRHTTVSSAEEWLATQAPPEDARVLVVAGNPHIHRNLRDIQNVLKAKDRQEVKLEICGPPASPNASIQLYLGEIGRLLYMDTLLDKQS